MSGQAHVVSSRVLLLLLGNFDLPTTPTRALTFWMDVRWRHLWGFIWFQSHASDPYCANFIYSTSQS